MKISELVERTGVSRATIKFYLRERLLMPGDGASAAEYTDRHLERVQLVRALTGASLPLGRIRTVLAAIDDSDGDLYGAMGGALNALPPYLEETAPPARALRILDRLGQTVDEYSVAHQLEHALDAADAAGVPLSDTDVLGYARAVRGIAEAEWARVLEQRTPHGSVRFAVLGTVLYEPVIAALRRLAHHDLAHHDLAQHDLPHHPAPPTDSSEQ